jgi:hypothetical protein
MDDAQTMAEFIKQQLPNIEPGTLRFWGEWFGRPYDNLHRLVDCDAQGDLLHVHFKEGEVLSVWSPRDLHIGPSKLRSEPILRIRDAARVRWDWFSYGRPQIAANRYFEQFVRTSEGIEATTNVDWYSPNLKPLKGQPAVEML